MESKKINWKKEIEEIKEAQNDPDFIREINDFVKVTSSAYKL